jgi:hypothetical protein
MVIRYLKGEYVGESRDANSIIKSVSPYITKKTATILNASSTKAALPTLTLKKNVRINTWRFARVINILFTNIPR